MSRDGNSRKQVRLLERAHAAGGTLHVKGGEVRTARSLSLHGDLRDDGAVIDGCNADGERWTFVLRVPAAQPRLREKIVRKAKAPASPPGTADARGTGMNTTPTFDEKNLAWETFLSELAAKAQAGVSLEAILAALPDDDRPAFTGRQIRFIERTYTEHARIGRMARWAIRYTTAPASYDGFGTEDLGPVAKYRRHGKVLRKVLIDPQHLDWQDMRFGSGSHPCFDDAELAKLRAANLLLEVTP